MKAPASFEVNFGGVALTLSGEITLADGALTSPPATAQPVIVPPVVAEPVTTAPVVSTPSLLALPARMMTDAWPLNQKATQFPLETRSLKYDLQDGLGFVVRDNIPKCFATTFGAAHIGFDTSMPITIVDSVANPEVLTHVTITNCFEADANDTKKWSNTFVVSAPIAGAKIEGGPNAALNSDRHVLVYDVATGLLYEFWSTYLADPTLGNFAGAYIVWRVNELHQNPLGTNSGDAAGLPIAPLLLRKSEVNAGVVPHAVRMTMNLTRQNNNNGAFCLPACHASGNNWGSPAYEGMRMYLRPDFPTPTEKDAAVIVQCLKDYGTVVADNGRSGSIICDDDPTWDQDMLQRISISMTLNDFIHVNAGPIIDSSGQAVQ